MVDYLLRKLERGYEVATPISIESARLTFSANALLMFLLRHTSRGFVSEIKSSRGSERIVLGPWAMLAGQLAQNKRTKIRVAQSWSGCFSACLPNPKCLSSNSGGTCRACS